LAAVIDGGKWLSNNHILAGKYMGRGFLEWPLLPHVFFAPLKEIKVLDNLFAKKAVGFDPTLTDPWGRLLSYQLLASRDDGVDTTFSSVANSEAFIDHDVPYPIITSIGVRIFDGKCLPDMNATTY